jgi:hypothetical protein
VEPECIYEVCVRQYDYESYIPQTADSAARPGAV